MFAELFAVMAPVLIAAAIGYGWARSGQDYPTEFVTRIVLNVSTPCLVLSTLSRTEVDVQAFSGVALACVLVSLLMAVIGLLLARACGQDWRVIVPAYLFPNSGNMGLPVALYAFGESGLALAVAFFLMLSVGHFSVGMLLSGAERSLRRLILHPIMLSLALALLMLVFDFQLPRWLANTTSLLGSMAIPLMLVTLGVSLARIRVEHLGMGLLLGALRILCGAAAGWLVAAALELPLLSQAAVVMQSAMPVAVFNYLFAVRGNRSPELVASLVMCSTLLSFALIPLLLALWLPRLPA